MEDQIWRFYDDLEGTSIMCESQEECEHLVSKFAEAAKKGFFKDCEDFFPFYEDVQFKEDDSITPMGYECTLYANVKLDLTHWGSHVITHRIAHYFYYHDRDEEAERERVRKELFGNNYADTDSVKKPYTPPTLTAIVRGEVCKFVSETASPTDWTKTEPDTHLETLIDMLEHVLDSARGYKTTNTRCGWVVEIPMEFDNFKDLIKTTINELYPF